MHYERLASLILDTAVPHGARQVSEDTFMPMYQLRQNIADDGKPVKYRYNVAPQNVLTLYVPPKSVTVGG